MKGNQYKGFTLVEVIIAFVLVSIIALMVTLSVTSTYKMSTKLKDLPNSYYKAQNEVERTIDKLSATVKEYFRAKNELSKYENGKEPADLLEKMAAADAILKGYENEDVTLFGKTVKIFKFDKDYTYSGGQTIHIAAGAVNFVPIERPVAKIAEVRINETGVSEKSDMYFGTGKTVSTSVTYKENDDKKYKFKELYQWYKCTESLHTAAFGNGPHYDGNEELYKTLYTIYPNNFTIIPGATGASITVSKEYEGKLLLCVATPLSKSGTMGESVVSNYIYISPLPKLSVGDPKTGGYKMVIEPSLVPINYSPEEFISVGAMVSRIPETTSFIAMGGSSPQLSVFGAPTDTNLKLSSDGSGNYSRFLRFNEKTRMRSSGLKISTGDMIFAVVKDTNKSSPNFVETNSKAYGFRECLYAGDGSGDTGWTVVVMRMAKSSPEIRVGNSAVDIAELIVTPELGEKDIASVVKYLAEKYHISANYIANP